jgi:hypothetical protein
MYQEYVSSFGCYDRFATQCLLYGHHEPCGVFAANLGTGVWFRRLDGIIVLGNIVSRSTGDQSGPNPGIVALDGVTRSIVHNNLCS